MRLADKVRQNRQRIMEISARYGAGNVRLIGSVARGDDDEQSDVDLLVRFEKGRSLMDQAGLMLELESLLGCKVDVADDRGLRDRVRSRVMREAVAL